ncbi:MAG: MFS transporter [Planctomycetaceae bacterium]|nr:MFS transporter [Planctomycetaceae bacterium]
MSREPLPALDESETGKWYAGITRYQWLVLFIACLGWVFDIFEGQIFVASMNEAMPSLIEQEAVSNGQTISAKEVDQRKALYNNIALAAFLVGGAIGGIVFGIVSDKIGRKRTMSLTILFYSLFTCLSAFSGRWWHLAGYRFLVAMGVGGEWAVASAMVYEVFPKRARAHVGGIFHASSVLGTYLAVAAGTFIIANDELNQAIIEWAQQRGFTDPDLLASLKWRIGFALGALPALLIIWIRASLKEPEGWQQAKDRAQEDQTQKVGQFNELFSSAYLRNTVVGFLLAAVGMATFWGVHIYGKNVLRTAAETQYLTEKAGVEDLSALSADDRKTALTPYDSEIKRWEMLGMLLVTTGGGIGLLAFGPISQRVGRRGAFILFHLGGLVSALALFQTTFSEPSSLLYLALPVFGFLTLGMHAGYAIYFPELFPTRLRATGSGFCFNGGRIAAAPMLFATGFIQSNLGVTLFQACSMLSLLYLLGVVVTAMAPETRHRAFEDASQEAV